MVYKAINDSLFLYINIKKCYKNTKTNKNINKCLILSTCKLGYFIHGDIIKHY